MKLNREGVDEKREMLIYRTIEDDTSTVRRWPRNRKQ